MELCDIKGVGKKRLEMLHSMGIFSLLDLATFFPYKYIKIANPLTFEEIIDGENICIKVKILQNPKIKYSKKSKMYIESQCEFSNCEISLIWFNAKYILNNLHMNDEYYIYGKIAVDNGKFAMINPSISRENKSGLIPCYSIKDCEISQNIFHDIVNCAIDEIHISTIIKNNLSLMSISDAIRNIHNPTSYKSIVSSKSRLALEEILQLMTAIAFSNANDTNDKKREYSLGIDCLCGHINNLPYVLTDGQKHALERILELLKGNLPMQSILIGDVGCGKTVVALLAMAFCHLCGYQSAMLAPTEILAMQHYENAVKMFGEDNVGLLVGSMTAAQKLAMKQDIEAHKKHIIIGTHSLVYDSVKFDDLALVITDEQHRFGVKQRWKFSKKGYKTDMLAMSATPIPRTLSLAVYGDLDIIKIDEKPSNRKPIKTSIVPIHKLNDLIAFLQKNSLQTFMVCPSIYSSDENSMVSVQQVQEKMSKYFGEKVDVLHGDMKSDKKREIESAFRNNDLQVLIATSIIEIGIDIKDADVIVIFDADRFGLASLHQLRGRVGRGEKQGYCFLFSGSDSCISKKRLKILCDNSSGFKIAEKDFSLRGCGDMLGDKQSGFVNAVFKNIALDSSVVTNAKNIFASNKIMLKEFQEKAFSQYANLTNITL